MNTARWDVDGVRDDLRAYVVESLGTPDGVLVVDESGFLKKGTQSAGVKRQYSGTAGRIENCQIGVFLSYASAQGHALLDRELYLPHDWADDADRRAEAKVPPTLEFATKPELARQMLERALTAGVPCVWVTGDSIYGGDGRLRLWLEEQGQPFVLGITKGQYLWGGFEQQRAAAWRMAIWHIMRSMRPLIRRSRRWSMWRVNAGRLRNCFEMGKQEVGLDEYEVRHYPGWYRHITLAMLVLAFLVVTRQHTARPEAPQKRKGPARLDSVDGARSASPVNTCDLSRGPCH